MIQAHTDKIHKFSYSLMNAYTTHVMAEAQKRRKKTKSCPLRSYTKEISYKIICCPLFNEKKKFLLALVTFLNGFKPIFGNVFLLQSTLISHLSWSVCQRVLKEMHGR